MIFQFVVINSDILGAICCLNSQESCISDQPVVQFTEETLKKCKKILAFRVENQLKYSSVILPEDSSSPKGYHRGCYRRFTGLSKLQSEQMRKKESTSKVPLLRYAVTEAKPDN